MVSARQLASFLVIATCIAVCSTVELFLATFITVPTIRLYIISSLINFRVTLIDVTFLRVGLGQRLLGRCPDSILFIAPC